MLGTWEIRKYPLIIHFLHPMLCLTTEHLQTPPKGQHNHSTFYWVERFPRVRATKADDEATGKLKGQNDTLSTEGRLSIPSKSHLKDSAEPSGKAIATPVSANCGVDSSPSSSAVASGVMQRVLVHIITGTLIIITSVTIPSANIYGCCPCKIVNKAFGLRLWTSNSS